MSQAGGSLNFQHDHQGKPALNDLGDVGAIVQKFVDDTLKSFDAFNRGETSRDEAMGKIQAESTRLGRAFMGQDPAYYATEWNHPNRLGAHIKAQRSVKFEDANQNPGEAFFNFIAAQAVKAACDLHEGDEDPEWVGFMLQRSVKSAVSFLLTGEG